MRRNKSLPTWVDVKYPLAGITIGGLIMVGTAKYFLDKLHDGSFVFGAGFIFILGLLVAGISYTQLKTRF